MKLILILAIVCAAARGAVYFEEDFSAGWEDRWVLSAHKGSEAGKFELSHGKFFGDEEKDVGLKTMEDARFYQISAAFPGFSNKGKTLVTQFSVKHEQNIDCGGGYVKLLPAGLDQNNFNGDSEYNIMFGPDICGGTRRTHAIVNHKGKNHLIKDTVTVKSDEKSHLYTFVINADQTYDILIDNVSVKSGKLEEDWDFLPPKEINDPSVSKPADWVDARMIDDPEDVKPEGYDDIPQNVVDPDAEQPEDWDTELDGEWEAPVISNPEYKGPWRVKRIENPDYIGEWIHPQIPNPDYYHDDSIYAFNSHAFLGIEIWQVKSGTIFDNFLVTDDAALATARATEILVRFAAEEAAYNADQEESMKAAEADLQEDEDEDEGDDSDAPCTPSPLF
jgi:calreticulin